LGKRNAKTNVQKRKQKRKKNTWGKLQCFKEKDKKKIIIIIKYVKNDNFGKKEKLQS
jgi:hypothetical protein